MTLKWTPGGFVKAIEAKETQNMRLAVKIVRDTVVAKVSVSQPLRRGSGGVRVGLDPSKPGEPPKRVESTLFGSIASEVVKEGINIVGRVGTNDKKAKFLEFGTSRIKQRPFLRPSLKENIPTLRKILT